MVSKTVPEPNISMHFSILSVSNQQGQDTRPTYETENTLLCYLAYFILLERLPSVGLL